MRAVHRIPSLFPVTDQIRTMALKVSMSPNRIWRQIKDGDTINSRVSHTVVGANVKYRTALG